MQRLDKTVVSLNFQIQIGYDAIERHAVHVEILILGFNFFQGEAEIKSIFLFLRIKSQSKLVAMLHDVNHFLVLFFVVFQKVLLGLSHLLIVTLQGVTQCLQSLT